MSGTSRLGLSCCESDVPLDCNIRLTPDRLSCPSVACSNGLGAIASSSRLPV